GLSLHYFSQQKAGWIIARLTSDVDSVSDVLSQGMPTLVANVILLPAAVIALLIADWRLGLVVAAIMPPALVLTRWFQRASHVALVESRNRIGAVTAQIAESVSGMAVVQGFNRERRFQREFDDLNDANLEQHVKVQKIFSIFFPSIEFMGMVATGAVLYTGSTLLAHHALTIGTLITALYLLQLVFQPLQELSDVYGQLQAGAAAMVKIATILDEEPEIRDARAAKELPRIEGDLEIDHVERPLREAGCNRRGGRGGRSRDRRRPDRLAALRRSRARGTRGRLRSLGGRAAADLDRARPACRPAHPDPRRGDVEHRPADR